MMKVEHQPLLVGPPVRASVAIGDVDPWTLLASEDEFGPDQGARRWGEILLRAKVTGEVILLMRSKLPIIVMDATVKTTWTYTRGVCLLEQPKRMEELQAQLNADGGSPPPDEKTSYNTSALVPVEFRKDSISLQEIDNLACSRTFFGFSEFFRHACCWRCGGKRVADDWRVYVHGDREPELEASEERRLYQWVVVNGTLKPVSPLSFELHHLDLTAGGSRVEAIVRRFSLARAFALGWWFLLLFAFMGNHIEVPRSWTRGTGPGAGENKGGDEVPAGAAPQHRQAEEEAQAHDRTNGMLPLMLPPSLTVGLPVLTYWFVWVLLLEIAHSAGISFQNALEKLRRQKRHLLHRNQLGSPVGPNGENAKNARKTCALITDVIEEGDEVGGGGNKVGAADCTTNYIEDRVMVENIASRVGENRHHMQEEDRRIYHRDGCGDGNRCGMWWDWALHTLLWYVPVLITLWLLVCASIKQRRLNESYRSPNLLAFWNT